MSSELSPSSIDLQIPEAAASTVVSSNTAYFPFELGGDSAAADEPSAGSSSNSTAPDEVCSNTSKQLNEVDQWRAKVCGKLEIEGTAFEGSGELQATSWMQIDKDVNSRVSQDEGAFLSCLFRTADCQLEVLLTLENSPIHGPVTRIFIRKRMDRNFHSRYRYGCLQKIRRCV